MSTNTEIHFLPVDESHTHAPSRDTSTKHIIETRWPSLLLQVHGFFPDPMLSNHEGAFHGLCGP